jgi:hypothetical protein
MAIATASPTRAVSVGLPAAQSAAATTRYTWYGALLDAHLPTGVLPVQRREITSWLVTLPQVPPPTSMLPVYLPRWVSTGLLNLATTAACTDPAVIRAFGEVPREQLAIAAVLLTERAWSRDPSTVPLGSALADLGTLCRDLQQRPACSLADLAGSDPSLGAYHPGDLQWLTACVYPYLVRRLHPTAPAGSVSDQLIAIAPGIRQARALTIDIATGVGERLPQVRTRPYDIMFEEARIVVGHIEAAGDDLAPSAIEDLLVGFLGR